jgi:hypothetical protein
MSSGQKRSFGKFNCGENKNFFSLHKSSVVPVSVSLLCPCGAEKLLLEKGITITTAECAGSDQCPETLKHKCHTLTYTHNPQEFDKPNGKPYTLSLIRYNTTTTCCVRVISHVILDRHTQLKEYMMDYFQEHQTFRNLLHTSVYEGLLHEHLEPLRRLSPQRDLDELYVVGALAEDISCIFWEEATEITPTASAFKRHSALPKLPHYQLKTPTVQEFLQRTNGIVSLLATTRHRELISLTLDTSFDYVFSFTNEHIYNRDDTGTYRSTQTEFLFPVNLDNPPTYEETQSPRKRSRISTP